MDISAKDSGRMGGQRSVQKRFAGKSKEEIKAIMASVRAGTTAEWFKTDMLLYTDKNKEIWSVRVSWTKRGDKYVPKVEYRYKNVDNLQEAWSTLDVDIIQLYSNSIPANV